MNLIELSEINVNIKLRSAAQPCYRLPAPARFESFRICRTTNASVYTAINPDTAGAIEPISSRLSGQRVNTSQMSGILSTSAPKQQLIIVNTFFALPFI